MRQLYSNSHSSLVAVADTKIEASDKYTVLTPRGVKNISSLKVVKRLQEFYYSYVTAGFGLNMLYVLLLSFS